MVPGAWWCNGQSRTCKPAAVMSYNWWPVADRRRWRTYLLTNADAELWMISVVLFLVVVVRFRRHRQRSHDADVSTKTVTTSTELNIAGEQTSYVSSTHNDHPPTVALPWPLSIRWPLTYDPHRGVTPLQSLYQRCLHEFPSSLSTTGRSDLKRGCTPQTPPLNPAAADILTSSGLSTDYNRRRRDQR